MRWFAQGYWVQLSIMSSSSSSSLESADTEPHPRDCPSSGGPNILRRFAPCSEVRSDEVGGSSVAVGWASGDGDEARCRLSISLGEIVETPRATQRTLCDEKRSDGPDKARQRPAPVLCLSCTCQFSYAYITYHSGTLCPQPVPGRGQVHVVHVPNPSSNRAQQNGC
jgi:hypothetical protein